ncbi:MAG: dihydrolipoyl dehydrogenase [Elusimicrobia bacterium CG08_land_8_20_14_0_20_51_18]|nr:MAG: dihydrolipoyl dehydrogenase [Elusimicrobia bacterium CG08_land_8_20_14_0_20_51_18]
MKAIVIGSGPGGYPAALKLKALGANVTIVEAGDFGGTCLNRGCIPSKALLEIGHRLHNFEDMLGLAENRPEINFHKLFSWEKIKAHKRDVVGKMRVSLEKLFQLKKIDVIRGRASFVSDKEIAVAAPEGEKRFSFDFAVIAAGTEPAYPPPFDAHRDKLTDSDTIFDLNKFPAKLAVVGAGVIGLELACFFNALGSEVEILEIMSEILPFEDAQIVRTLKTSMEKRGVKFRLGVKAKAVLFEGGKKIIELENGERVEADEILVGAGRKSNLDGLDLEKAGIKAGKWIQVGPDLKTSNPAVYAIGDINGISLLAHSAERQGEIAAENIKGKNEVFNADIVPKCVYTWPELASVGLNKKEADEKGIKNKVRKSYFQALGRAIASMNTEGLCQIVTDENDVVIGAQIAGGPATEIIHIPALAVKTKMKSKELNSMIFAHPSMSEIIKEALGK